MVKGSLNRKKVYAWIERFIEEHGRIPTCPELREFIGSGSMGTIHKYLSDFKNELDNEDAQAHAGGSPAIKCEIPPELEKIWKSVVLTVREESWRENEAIKDSIKAEISSKDKQIAALEESLKECREIMNTLSDEIVSQASDIKMLTGQNMGLAEEITKTKAIIGERDGRIKELLAEAETSKADFDEAQRIIGKLTAEIEAIKEKGARKAA